MKFTPIKTLILFSLLFFSFLLAGQTDTLLFIDNLSEQEIAFQKYLIENSSDSIFWNEEIHKECDCSVNNFKKLKPKDSRSSRVFGKRSYANTFSNCSSEEVQKYILEMDSLLPSFISMPNEVMFNEKISAYRKNGLWGVKNNKGKILLKPSFVQIEYDTISSGIIAYDSIFSYYFTQDFKQKFKDQKYYSIASIDKNIFIVQSATGFGISNGEKEIIPTNNFDIKRYRETNLYEGLDKDLGHFWLSPDFTSKIYMNGVPHIFDNRYWNVQKKLFDVKQKKQLFCTKYVEVVILDLKNKLVKVKRKHHSEALLFNFAGKRIANQIFFNIHPFTSSNLAVASILKDGQVLNGVINTTGEWLIKPQYPMMYSVKGHYRTQDPLTKKIGLLDKNGNWLLEPQHNNVVCLDSLKNIWLTHNIVENKHFFDVFDIQKNKKLHSKLPYRTIERKYPPQSDNYFILATNNNTGRYDLLDNTFQKIIEGKNCSYRFFDNKIIQTDGSKSRLFDLEGNEIPLFFNSEKLSNIAKIRPIGTHTAFVYKEDTEEIYSYSKGKLVESTSLPLIQKSYNCHREKQKGIFSFSFAKNHGLVKSDGTKLTLTNFRIPEELDIINGSTIYELPCGEYGIYFFNKKKKQNYLNYMKPLGFNLFTMQYQRGNNSLFSISNANNIPILKEKKGIFELYGGLIKIWDKETLSFYDRTGQLVHSF